MMKSDYFLSSIYWRQLRTHEKGAKPFKTCIAGCRFSSVYRQLKRSLMGDFMIVWKRNYTCDRHFHSSILGLGSPRKRNPAIQRPGVHFFSCTVNCASTMVDLNGRVPFEPRTCKSCQKNYWASTFLPLSHPIAFFLHALKAGSIPVFIDMGNGLLPIPLNSCQSRCLECLVELILDHAIFFVRLFCKKLASRSKELPPQTLPEPCVRF